MLTIHIWIFHLPYVIYLTFATALYPSLVFFLYCLFFSFPDACVHVIESEPGAGSRPGVQQPNKLSAQYPARPAGKQQLCGCGCGCVCVCVYFFLHASVIGVTPYLTLSLFNASACTVCILLITLSNLTGLSHVCFSCYLFIFLLGWHNLI